MNSLRKIFSYVLHVMDAGIKGINLKKLSTALISLVIVAAVIPGFILLTGDVISPDTPVINEKNTDNSKESNNQTNSENTQDATEKNASTYTEPNLNRFVSRLKEEILYNPSFVIKAEDTGDILKPDDKQRNALADSLSEVWDPVMFDGGINDYREAAYPFYRLEFNNDLSSARDRNNNRNNNNYNTSGKEEPSYSLVVTTGNSLLLLMGANTSYDYGLGSLGMPVRFVTPNKEFIESIKEILPARPNNSTENINYLLNAEKLRFKGAYSGEETGKQVQINKCVRAIKKSMGDEIEPPVDNEKNYNTDESHPEKYLFEFEFRDGSLIVLTYTDNYIEYCGKYYKPLKKPYDLIAGLFAAYF